MAHDLLFKRVKCSGYLKPVKDGRYIAVDQQELTASYVDTNTITTEVIGEECECDGSYEFLKTYMQPVQRACEGVVVGIKNVVVSAWLVAEIFYSDGYSCARDYVKVSAEPKEQKECAIVYYANNRKHYVPLELIVEVKEQV